MFIQTSAPMTRKPVPGPRPPEQAKTEKIVDEFVREHPVMAAGVLGSAGYTAASAFPSTWLHEMGHATAIEHLYSNGRPSVEVFPFKGGVTRWYPSELSPLGKTLGNDGARALVAASGTLVDIGVATGTFGLGFTLRKKHPIAGAALMGYGAMTVVNSLLYAGSAVGGNLAALSSTGNDFATLAVKGGLHPLASMAILASILPLEYAALKWLENKREGKEEEARPPSVFAPQRPLVALS
jgi:hypothetical protein